MDRTRVQRLSVTSAGGRIVVSLCVCCAVWSPPVAQGQAGTPVEAAPPGASVPGLEAAPNQTGQATGRVRYLSSYLQEQPTTRRQLPPYGTGVAVPEVAPESLTFVGATLIDGTGSPPVSPANVVVRDGRIVCAGPPSSCAPIDGSVTIDAEGKWIIPGLVDAHVHYSQTGWADGRPDAYDARDRFPYPAAVRELRQNPTRFYRSYLCSGVTATFDVGGYPWTWDLRAAADSDPWAPHVAAAGPVLSARDHWVNLPGERQFLYMADEGTVAEATQYLLSSGTDAVKVWYIVNGQSADTVRWKSLMHLVAGQARASEVPLIVHATNLWAAKVAVGAGTTLLVHSVSDQLVDEEFISLALQAGTLYTPTLIVGRGYDQLRSRSFQPDGYELGCIDPATLGKAFLTDSLPDPPAPEQLAATARASDENARRLAANLIAVQSAGIPVVVGTDAGNPLTLHGPSIFLEMEAMAAAGLRPMEILVAATRNGAQAMNRLDDFGTVEPGKIADLVILDADPLDNVAHLRQIAIVVRQGHAHTRTELAYPEPD